MLIPTCQDGDAVLGMSKVPFDQKSYPGLASYYKHPTAKEVRGVVGDQVWEDYLVFAFVRNPYSRIVSWYTYAQHLWESQNWGRRKLPWLYKMLGKPGKWNKGVVKAFLETDSFPEFLRHSGSLEHGWRSPQVDWLRTPENSGLEGIDYVGKLESIETDLAEVSNLIGIPTPEIEKHNASSKRPYRSFYEGQEDIRIVQERYALDFDLLGYSRTFDELK